MQDQTLNTQQSEEQPAQDAQDSFQDQLTRVNALYNQKQAELSQAGLQRQKNLENLLRDCHAQLSEKVQRVQQLDRECSTLKQENEDMRHILSQYEDRFVEVRKHIEQLNLEKREAVEKMSSLNGHLQEKLEKVERENEELRAGRLTGQEKLREIEWAKDQDTKQLNNIIKKMREEQEKLKMEHI